MKESNDETKTHQVSNFLHLQSQIKSSQNSIFIDNNQMVIPE